MHDQNDIAYLALIKMGYAQENISCEGDYYRVENDILFEKPFLKKIYQENWVNGNNHELSKVLKHTELPIIQLLEIASLINLDSLREKVQDIKVLISEENEPSNNIEHCVSEIWKGAIIKALKNWNAIEGCSIHFSIVHQGPCDIQIVETHIREDLDTEAIFPNTMNVGSMIRINKGWKSILNFNKVSTIMHALGHCLGLHHPRIERARLHGLLDDDHYYSDDTNSLMYSSEQNDFSESDYLVLRLLFPTSDSIFNHKFEEYKKSQQKPEIIKDYLSLNMQLYKHLYE